MKSTSRLAALFLIASGSMIAQSCTPVKYVNHRMMIPVVFNGTGPFFLLLDTGSPITVIDYEIYQKIGGVQIAEVHRVFGKTEHSGFRSQIATIRVAGKTKGLFELEVYHFSPTTLNAGIIGLLGQDFLENYTVAIDYKHKCISLQ